MDSRSVAFLEVMVAIGVIGLVAFLIFLVSRQAISTAPDSGQSRYQPHWVELLLAAIAVLVVAALLIWQFPPWADGADAGNGTVFFAIMLIIGGGALLVFLITMFWRMAHRPAAPAQSQAGAPRAPAVAAPAQASYESPAATRLLGLLAFAVVFLILNWTTVAHSHQYAMMLNLIYPAGLIVALVMLFDKASRAWHIKQAGESLREWLHCNLILLLFLIAYLNLLTFEGAGDYRALFWDFVHVVAFLLTLWTLDRKTSRLRFLVAHGYLIVLAVLLLLWRNAQGVEVPAQLSWWSTIWPFFFLALIFFVLEIIVLIASRDSPGQGAGTAKDVIFVILAIIVLIAARPAPIAT